MTAEGPDAGRAEATDPVDGPSGERMPMFPLGSALVPGMRLPLRVFEPRYRQMAREVLEGSGEFGVVLIERGFEVGGGDTRFDVGTVARVLRAAQTPDGRYALDTVGTDRMRVLRWLPEDPYPVAQVERLVDPPPGPAAADRRDEVEKVLRRILAVRSELGEPVDLSQFELHPDPAVASWHAALLGGLGPMDVQALLAADGPDERLEQLGPMLADAVERYQLLLGTSDPGGSPGADDADG
jgi:Lon protease-like protein